MTSKILKKIKESVTKQKNIKDSYLEAQKMYLKIWKSILSQYHNDPTKEIFSIDTFIYCNQRLTAKELTAKNNSEEELAKKEKDMAKKMVINKLLADGFESFVGHNEEIQDIYYISADRIRTFIKKETVSESTQVKTR